MERVRFAWGCAWLVCGATVLAPAYAEPKDALRAAVDADELSLLRVVARAGDDAVLAALRVADDPVLQLAAIRTAPHLNERAAALLPLAEIAASRDPELAPAAAFRVHRIAQELVREHLELHEVVPSELGPARAALVALEADESARPDIRLYAGASAHLLGTLGVR